MSNVPIKAETNRRSSVESTGAYVVAYIAVLALKWPMIDQQPVWDEAFSVHPAAMTLAHNGFDLWGLLHEPSFAEGGPNVHAGSLVTVLTAVAYRWLEGGPWLFPLLHLGHFAVAAYCLAAAFHFSRALFGPLLAALFTGAVLCYPLFHVQAGFMYLETPLLACTLSALTAWSTQRRKTALACAVLAVLVKVTGILVAGTLAAAWLLESRPGGRRIGWVLAAALVPGFILAALLLIVHTPGGAGYRPPPYGAYLRFYLADRLLQLPDLCFFFLVTLLVGVLRWKTVLRGLTARSPAVGGTGWSPNHAPHSARLCRRPRLGTQDDAPRIVQGHLAGRRLAVAHLLTLVFLAFHLAAPFVFENY
ncbi:MAG TPA: hypothetical protein VGX76_21205, partial [Pirellulales bacterium]|nr:hypothetical protein [Pirellulales bacterium]